MFLTSTKPLLVPILAGFLIFGASSRSAQQQGKDACHVYVVDIAKSRRAYERVPRTNNEAAYEKALSVGQTIFPEFRPTIGEEELTTRHYPFPGNKLVITASVFYTDESMASHGHGEFVSHSDSMLIGVTVSKRAKQNAIDASAENNAIVEVTDDQYTNKVRAKTFVTVRGRVYLVGIECDCMAAKRPKWTAKHKNSLDASVGSVFRNLIGLVNEIAPPRRLNRYAASPIDRLTVMNAEHYIQLRNEIAFESVSFGYTTVNLFPTEELEDAQVGYSISNSGEWFTGEKKGDWRKEWFVIGSEDLGGDPIFVDLTKPELPVFTAVHGEGDWDPVLIASSFKGFINALEQIGHVAQGRQNPVELERNPVSASERQRALSRIAELNPKASLEFWENWFAV